MMPQKCQPKQTLHWGTELELPVQKQTGYVKNIKPPAGGPLDEQVKAQSKRSEQSSMHLPGVPVLEVNPYDVDTDIEIWHTSGNTW